MTDEDPVDQIVGSLGHHPDDGRQRETKQQAGNAACPSCAERSISMPIKLLWTVGGVSRRRSFVRSALRRNTGSSRDYELEMALLQLNHARVGTASDLPPRLAGSGRVLYLRFRQA